MEKTKRQSNFELLRIFAMFIIILFHIQLAGPQPILTGDSGYFTQPIIYLRLLILEFGTPLGMIGNGLFIMISGYFLNANDHIDTGKIAKKLLLQLGFSVIVLMIANAVCITFFKNGPLSWKKVTMDDFNSCWWFVGYYFTVIILAKVFLNRYTAKLTRPQFKSLLLTILAVAQLSWTGNILESIAPYLRTLVIGIFFFLLGGYIARYNPFEKLKTSALFLTIAAAYAIRFLSAYNMVSQSIYEFVKSNSDGNHIPLFQGFCNYEITVVISVVCIFELFRRLHVPHSAAIDYIAKSTLIVYFIHGNSLFQCFYVNDNWAETLSASVWLYCLKWFKWAVIGFSVGLAAYALYTLLGKLLPRMRSWFVVQESGE